VLVDGERLNDQRDISSFAGVSLSLVDVNEIKRVEVVCLQRRTIVAYCRSRIAGLWVGSLFRRGPLALVSATFAPSGGENPL